MTFQKDRLNDKFDRDAAEFGHLRAFDPELPDFAWRIILGYTPKISTAQWLAVRPFTIENAVRMKPRTYDSVRRLMCMSARFNAWAWAARGGEVTAERLYSQNNVYRYLQECMANRSESHRWGVVRQLGTIADSLTERSVRRLPAPRLPGRRRPFTLSQIATMHSWARSLPTELKRQNASALLGLAGGAGLRSEEIVQVKIRDLEIAGGRLYVSVAGTHARTVPVMYPWNHTLLRSVENRTNPDAHVFHGYRFEEYPPRLIQMFLSDHPAQVRATVSQLRATWIIEHLNNGVPLPVLMTIAGVASAGSLDKYLKHTAPVNISEFAGLIIGEEVTR